jgi:CO dehydrogenase/acetyl-CoA synthase gamma subunit (corrinoid Fe-S protein)
MMSVNDAAFQDDGDLNFPVITISVAHDDLNEPVHVDLGSIPPFVAAAVLEKVADVLKMAVPAPRITFKGHVLVEPFDPQAMNLDAFLDMFTDPDEDEGQGNN